MITQVTPAEVASLIPNGATVAGDGFTMMGVADEIYAAIEQSFLDRGVPNGLTFVHAAGQSNRVDGLARLAHPGLLKRVVGPHWGLNPPMANVLGEDEVEAICLPQGQISTLYRTIAANRPGQLSTVGLGTFVDPRLDGGRINDSARAAVAPEDYVKLVHVDGREYLFYKSFPLDVAIIRGSKIDPDGNMSQDDDVTILDSLAIAQAVHNNGGIVIAQVKEIVERGDIPARLVNVPGVLVDYVMVTSDPAKYHKQTNSAIEVNMDLITGYASPQELADSIMANELEDVRIRIGERGAKLVRDGDIINLGTGLPGDSIGRALATSGQLAKVTLTVESGTYGGVPLGGVDFGCALHPAAIIGHPQQFDFYNGGGVDITFMGVGQVDGRGNINVSAFGGKAIGCGGFMDIVDGAKRICFLMVADSKHPKWVHDVDQLTFYGAAALDKGQEVYLASEHYLLQLTEQGWKVLEVDDNDAAREAASYIHNALY
ncbi:CoA-transferase [Trueperella bialowiezensis]|uniref:Butyrate--acetoacetate CoA-transferase subunit B n=1 Tax=Trueperella bialowiezensis TaxID=312285 RepID=A0A448PFB9_9ACTO|nr:CoA-transferase [Trueperella bialowiezensis]VEI13622.1 Butyrate--acetoacetate CoA-transferase subunit B [Trueperella bialowiezensis]